MTIATPFAGAVVAVLRDAVGLQVRGHQETAHASVAGLYGWQPSHAVVKSTFPGSKSTGFIEVADTAGAGEPAGPGGARQAGPPAGARCFSSIALVVDDLSRRLEAARRIEGARAGSACVVGVGYVNLGGEVLVEGRLTESDPGRLRVGMAMTAVPATHKTDEDGTAVVTYAFAPQESEAA